jgi:hypothetical protein
MNDDWRIHATLEHSREADELAERLQHGDLEHELDAGAGDRVIVSVDDHDLFLYAGGREQAERAAKAVDEASASHGWTVTTRLQRWHPVAEEWEDPDVPLPGSQDALAAEHEETVERERAETQQFGFSEYEVRVQCVHHHDARVLADRLEAEGIPFLRRWHYVLIGATDEDSAKRIADQITHDLPDGSTVTVEASMKAIWAETPVSPFTVLGGLGG